MDLKNRFYSLEFCHIYTNEVYSKEHQRSVDKLLHYIPQLPPGSFQTCVMIDNYNVTENLLNVDALFESLKQQGALPDYYAFEADLQKYATQLLGLIEDKNVLKSYQRYINGKEKLPCSFMTAIWYLIRLGELPADIVRPLGEAKFNVATNLINILPERFRAVEAQARRLIGGTNKRHLLSKIDYMFFDSLEN